MKYDDRFASWPVTPDHSSISILSSSVSSRPIDQFEYDFAVAMRVARSHCPTDDELEIKATASRPRRRIISSALGITG